MSLPVYPQDVADFEKELVAIILHKDPTKYKANLLEIYKGLVSLLKTSQAHTDNPKGLWKDIYDILSAGVSEKANHMSLHSRKKEVREVALGYLKDKQRGSNIQGMPSSKKHQPASIDIPTTEATRPSGDVVEKIEPDTAEQGSRPKSPAGAPSKDPDSRRKKSPVLNAKNLQTSDTSRAQPPVTQRPPSEARKPVTGSPPGHIEKSPSKFDRVPPASSRASKSNPDPADNPTKFPKGPIVQRTTGPSAGSLKQRPQPKSKEIISSDDEQDNTTRHTDEEVNVDKSSKSLEDQAEKGSRKRNKPPPRWVLSRPQCTPCVIAKKSCMVLEDEFTRQGHACMECKAGKKKCPLANAIWGLQFNSGTPEYMNAVLNEFDRGTDATEWVANPGQPPNDLGLLLLEILGTVRDIKSRMCRTDEALEGIETSLNVITNAMAVTDISGIHPQARDSRVVPETGSNSRKDKGKAPDHRKVEGLPTNGSNGSESRKCPRVE